MLLISNDFIADLSLSIEYYLSICMPDTLILLHYNTVQSTYHTLISKLPPFLTIPICKIFFNVLRITFLSIS